MTVPFGWKNEIKYVLNNLKKELTYYTDLLSSYKGHKDSEFYDLIQTLEILINSYRIGLLDFLQDFSSCKPEEENGDIRKEKEAIVKRYNTLVTDAIRQIKACCNTELSTDLIM